MIVPMLLMLAANLAFYWFSFVLDNNFKMKYLWQEPLLSLVGMQGQNYAAGGLKALWFVYTLCVCKVILQYLSTSKRSIVLPSLSIVFLVLTVVLDRKDISIMNAIIDVLLAFPFFYIGFLLRRFKDSINSPKPMVLLLLFLLCFVVVGLCGKYNGLIYLYRCQYSTSVLLCILGGVAGTFLVYVISVFCSKLFDILNIYILGGYDGDFRISFYNNIHPKSNCYFSSIC